MTDLNPDSEPHQDTEPPAPPAPENPSPAPEPDDTPPATHDLALSNGDVIGHHGAIPTHVHIGDVIHRVAGVFEREHA